MAHEGRGSRQDSADRVPERDSPARWRDIVPNDAGEGGTSAGAIAVRWLPLAWAQPMVNISESAPEFSATLIGS